MSEATVLVELLAALRGIDRANTIGATVMLWRDGREPRNWHAGKRRLYAALQQAERAATTTAPAADTDAAAAETVGEGEQG